MENKNELLTPEDAETAERAEEAEQAETAEIMTIEAEDCEEESPEDTDAEELPAKKPNPALRVLGGIGRTVKRHKILTALVILLVIAAIAGGIVWQRVQAAKAGTTYSFIRTTTLKKSTLEDTVSATGTVKSNDVSNVTIDNSVKTYKVKTVDVSVGDEVQAGDVILTLDTADLQESIDKALKKLADNQETLLKSYNTSVTNLQTAQTNYDQAVEDEQKAWNDYEEYNKKYKDYESSMNSAWSKCNILNDQVNALESKMNDELGNYNAVVGRHNDKFGDHYTGTQSKSPDDFYPTPKPDGTVSEETNSDGTVTISYIDKNGSRVSVTVSSGESAAKKAEVQPDATQAKNDAETEANAKYNSYLASTGEVDVAYTQYTTPCLKTF